MNRWTTLLAVIGLAVFATVGCSNNGNLPVLPSGDQTEMSTGASVQPSSDWLLGYYDIYFDIQDGTFEAVENRTTSFTLNIVPFLNKMMIPMNGITFDNIVIHGDDPAVLGVDVEFSVYHPFPGYDQYDAYDMRGVVIGNGSDSLAYNGSRIARRGTDLWMKNPDGYSRWFNPTEFTTELIFGYAPGGYQNLAGDANVNPYKYYAKHLGKDDNVWSFLTGDTNFDGIFESGSGRTMELEFPMPPEGIGLMFGYAVVVCWEEQGSSGPYYPVHIPETVVCSVTQTPDAWYNEIDGSGGDLILDIDLFAWNEQPSIVKIESSLIDGIAEFDFASYASEGGEHYSTWHVEAPATALHSADGHEYWVITECGAYDYSNGLPEIPHADGTLAAFFRYPAVVKHGPGIIPPEVYSIDPNEAYLDSAVDEAQITGNYFLNGATVKLVKNDDPLVVINGTGVVCVDTENLTCDFDLDSVSGDAEIGTYDVVVTNPDTGEGQLDDGFTITEPPEIMVTDIFPTQGYLGLTYEAVEIEGLGFEDGATAKLVKNDNPAVEIIGENVVFVDDTQLTADFDLDYLGGAIAEVGIYDVVVTNPDMAEGQLDDGFEVLDYPCAPNDWGDDFDSTPNGSYPSGWVNFWSGQSAYASTDQYYSGSQSFRQAAYSSWARYGGMPFTAGDKTFVCYEALCMLTHEWKRPKIGFAWKKTSSTTGHYATTSIGAPTYTQLYHWYHVVVKINMTEHTWTRWIDGDKISAGSSCGDQVSHDSFTHFFVGMGNWNSSYGSTGVVYWDDPWLYWEN